jgi:hypothetical protein
LKKLGVRGWRKIAKGTDAWKLMLKETRVRHGPWSQWRDRERERERERERIEDFAILFASIPARLSEGKSELQ